MKAKAPTGYSQALADAVKAKRLVANPCQGIDNLPRRTGKRQVYLSAEDVHRLADEAGEHRALVLVLAYTGIRWGEAVALRWQTSSSCVGGSESPRMLSSLVSVTPSVRPRAAKLGQCQCPNSCGNG